MDVPNLARVGQKALVRSVAFILVAAVAFGAGLLLGGNGTTAAAVVSRLPFTGDNLDATPDTSVNLDNFWKAWNALESQYVQTHASTSIPTAKEKLYGAIQGLAASYGDPYTVFLPPQEAKAFSETISGSFAGVGMELDKKDGTLIVVAPLKGTPADAAGVKAGDLIAAIDGTSTDGMPTDTAVRLIRGKAGTVVALTLVREGKVIELKITRAKIQVPETEDGLDEDSGVYHIALYQFTTSSGGAGIPRGTKIVMLIDGGSASASEILAGALQDNHAATIIGMKSFGKGSVQSLVNIGGGSLTVTVARWVTPAGHWIMGNGIMPDIIASSTPEAKRGEVDPQMDRAVQFLTTGK